MAFDLDQADWRTFRLDRLCDLRTSIFHFRPRPDPDPAEYVRRSIRRTNAGVLTRVVLRTDAASARQRIPGGWGRRDRSTTGPACSRRARWTGGGIHLGLLGDDVGMLDPPGLKESVAATAARFTAAAAGTLEP